ncbi:MAG TPA: hypothetical protein VL362_01090 [Patescibacteria group bacterium]|jgi:hypothetical protein|nr:hypothetical protein [Patescibacteria group bacterium]
MNSLVKRLQRTFPEYQFTNSEVFAWNPQTHTVLYDADGSPSRLLHEVAHGVLSHESYAKDVELLKMEADAWQRAKELAPTYELTIADDEIDIHMDSYRDWLHARSTCPSCDATGVQVSAEHYSCLECRTRWRVNEARTCGLRRYIEH